MGFEVFLQSYSSGQTLGGLPAQWVRELLGASVREEKPDLWRVEYGPNDFCHFYLTAAESNPKVIASVMVERPPANLRFWDSLLAIMRVGNFVLYYPGCSAPLVATESAMADVPLGMVEALGVPVCVTSGGQILERIQAD